MKKLLWVRADGGEPWGKRKKLVTTALESGADAVLVNIDEAPKAKQLGKIKVGVVLREQKIPVEIVMKEEREVDIVISTSGSGTVSLKSMSREIICGFYKEIKSKEDEQEIVQKGKLMDCVIIKARDWKIIPLENIIAALQKEKVKVIVEVSSVGEAKTAFETLEVGCDGVLVGDVRLIKDVKRLVEEMSTLKLSLIPVEVTKVEPKGMGDRVCVDAASIFSLGEGMLVGSQSSGLFLVHSETLESEYVASRPFRVNAGPVHAYTMLSDGKTTYLSELEAGDEILAVDAKGKTRPMIVGRCKIEKRPLLLVEAKTDGKTLKTLVQNAETINLVDDAGKAVSVTKLAPGDKVLAYIEDVGRHFGMKVEETIEEK